VARYVDGFVIPIPRKNTALYRRIAKRLARVWRDHGALEVCECIAEDVKVGARTSFPRAVKLKRGEVVWFSWIAFRSRAHRDRVNAAVMKDPRAMRLMAPPAPHAFDGRRLIYGGFRTQVEDRA
jgi:uncharacterized protein YbaA (DUF1428 family)